MRRRTNCRSRHANVGGSSDNTNPNCLYTRCTNTANQYAETNNAPYEYATTKTDPKPSHGNHGGSEKTSDGSAPNPH